MFPPGEAFVQSLRFNWQITQRTFQVLGKIVTGQVAAKSALSGPIEIARLSGAAARTSFVTLLQLMGLISISIAILNLLPIPMLDGGHVVFQLTELVRGKPVSEKAQIVMTQFGLLLVASVFIWVVYNDLTRLI